MAIRPSAWCGERLPVDPGLVVVALHEGPAGQLDEVAVAGVVLGQQGQVVVELLAPVGVAPGVVHPAPAGRPLVAGVVGHVGLGAEDRLDALLAALLVEVEDAVHVPVVGDADRGLAVGDGGPDDLADPGGAVEHRVLGVDVEVGEAASTRHQVHSLRSRARPSPCPQESVDRSQRCDSPTVARRAAAPGRPSARSWTGHVIAPVPTLVREGRVVGLVRPDQRVPDGAHRGVVVRSGERRALQVGQPQAAGWTGSPRSPGGGGARAPGPPTGRCRGG